MKKSSYKRLHEMYMERIKADSEDKEAYPNSFPKKCEKIAQFE